MRPRVALRMAPVLVGVLVALRAFSACTASHGIQPRDAAADSSAGAIDASARDAGADAGERRDCTQPSECVVVPMTCCGVCGAPATGDVTAIRKDAQSARTERCKTALCPACAQRPNPALVATCRSGRCEVVDIAASDPVSHCQSAADCRVRVSACCECGGDTSPYTLIAIASSSEQAYTLLVCAPNAACAACAPLYPSNVSASCAQSGHCATQVH